jgi:protein N-terminal asparagine amidohydrolase
VTACICRLNNSLRGNINWPVIYGIGVNVKTGDVFPATFPDKGPDIPLRSARHFTGCHEMLDIYDTNMGLLRIGPFNYRPMRGVDLWLSQNDEFILQVSFKLVEIQLINNSFDVLTAFVDLTRRRTT